MLAACLLLSACEAGPPPPTPLPTPSPPPRLRIGLSDSAAAFADLVSDPYSQRSEETILQFVIGNQQTLFRDLDAGELDAVLVHHLPPGGDNWFNPVALDGLLLITHPDNPLTGLTAAEAQAVFNGRISSWQPLGGPDQPITVISREAGSAARQLLQTRLMAEQRLTINAQIAPSDAFMREAVAADPQSIGYTMLGNSTDLNQLEIDGQAAAPATTTDQSYPFTNPLYFVHNSPAEPQGALRAFLAWLQSAEGQEIIGRQYGRVR